MWHSLIIAFALMLILEGLLPFLFPAHWKETFRRMIQLKDGQIRFFGISSIVTGLILFFVFQSF